MLSLGNDHVNEFSPLADWMTSCPSDGHYLCLHFSEPKHVACKSQYINYLGHTDLQWSVTRLCTLFFLMLSQRMCRLKQKLRIKSLTLNMICSFLSSSLQEYRGSVPVTLTTWNYNPNGMSGVSSVSNRTMRIYFLLWTCPHSDLPQEQEVTLWLAFLQPN